MKNAFTLAEVMVVVAIIGLLAAIAIPNFVKAATQQKKTCLDNLKQINVAKKAWAWDNKKASNDIPAMNDIFGYTLHELKCPASGIYTLGCVGQYPTCSYQPRRTNQWHVPATK